MGRGIGINDSIEVGHVENGNETKALLPKGKQKEPRNQRKRKSAKKE